MNPTSAQTGRSHWRLTRRLVFWLTLGLLLQYLMTAVIVLGWWGTQYWSPGISLPGTRMPSYQKRGERLQVLINSGLWRVTRMDAPGGMIQEYSCALIIPNTPLFEGAFTDLDLDDPRRLPDSLLEIMETAEHEEFSRVEIGWPFRSNACLLMSNASEHGVTRDDDPDIYGVLCDIRGGWSLPSREEVVLREQTQALIEAGESITSEPFMGIAIRIYDNGLEYPRVIPLTPVFPGYLINILCIALAAFLIPRIPFVIQRLKRREGQCRKCGYDLASGGQSTCPECGKPAMTK